MRVLSICFSALIFLVCWAAADSAAILYPSGSSLTYNYNDVVYATYTSPWPSGVNLTVWCYGDPAKGSDWYWAHYGSKYY
jgi:hypothetical protein